MSYQTVIALATEGSMGTLDLKRFSHILRPDGHTFPFDALALMSHFFELDETVVLREESVYLSSTSHEEDDDVTFTWR